MGVELTGKTLGLIGCGNIGSIVADRAHGLKMKVIAYDPFLTPERAVELGRREGRTGRPAPPRRLHHLHTPLTDQTRNILSRENLAKTKKGVRIINCARGGLIDEAALKEGLDSGHVGRRGARRVRDRAGEGEPAVRHAGLHLDAASRRVDDRSAGQCRDPGRRADGRFPVARRRHQRAQYAVAVGRGSAAAQALHGARRKARQPGRPARARRDHAASRSRSRAPRPSSTRSRSPARCWPGSCASIRTR